MEKEYIIEIPEENVARFCGINDKNLTLIEKNLGIPIYSRGNLLSIADERLEIRDKFKFIVDRILDEISDGSDCSEDLIKSILLLRQKSKRFSTSEFSISIFGSNKKIYPRTSGQAELVWAMRNFDLVFATGPAGSGKTFVAVAEALSLLLSKRVNSLILTRPVVEAGESLGFLPGTLEEKIHPYLRPLIDSISTCISHENVKKLTENGSIEIAPLAYMRGRTLNNCAVILDEAQNTTAEQMKMLLTRIGEGTKIFITGDETQIDLPKKKSSGLIHSMKILKNVDGIGFVKLSEEDIVRSELVKRIVQAYELDSENQKSEEEKKFDLKKRNPQKFSDEIKFV